MKRFTRKDLQEFLEKRTGDYKRAIESNSPMAKKYQQRVIALQEIHDEFFKESEGSKHSEYYR